MDDIYNLILRTTYDQCLKLLDPRSSEFKRHFGNADPLSLLDAEERMMLSGAPQKLQYLQMGGCDIKEIEQVTRTPAIYIANGTESVEIPQGSGVANRLGIELPFVGELFPIVLRLVVNQGIAPPYEESNPVIIARIREQLNYFLDAINFMGLSVDRIGYEFPSVVLEASLAVSYSLEAIATPWEVYDVRLEVIFKRQKSMFYE